MNRSLSFSLTNSQHSDPSELKVLDFEFEEGLSTPFSGHIQFAYRFDSLKPYDFIDQSVSLKVYRNGALERSFHAIVKSFTKKETGFGHTFYELILMPELARLAYRHNCRIYQNKTVQAIAELLFDEGQLTDYAWALRQPHEAREYCVQYDENDLQFIQRLFAEEGIFYYFEHTSDKHTLVMTDHTSTVNSLSYEPEYNALSGGLMNDPYISSFHANLQLAPSEVVLKDYYFKRPSSGLESNKYSDSGLSKISDYEHYDFPGRYVKEAVGKRFSEARIHFLRRDARTGSGLSNVSQLLPGHKMTMQYHPEAGFDQPWFLTHVQHKGSQPQALEEYGGEGMTTYSNSFAGIPATLQWAPTPWVLRAVNPKSLMCGPQIAKVTGASGEEIYTNEFGQVKLQFPWDRYGNNDENSSTWIRVSQGWAGASFGQEMVPRVGHEVVVDYIEGDPDQPIIIGSVYNAHQALPYKLPEHKTRSVLKSKTHKGEGFNELTFEDEASQEFIYMHAQKDMNVKVKNDQVTHIKHDHHLQVDNHLTEVVKGSASYTVVGERKTEIKGNDTHIVMGQLSQEIAENWISETGESMNFEAGYKQVIDAGGSVTFKVGGSFMRIDPSGIYFVAPTVNLLSGGGGGHGGTESDLPKDPEVIKRVLFNLGHNPEAPTYINEPYVLYRNGAFMENGYTDEKGNVRIKHSPNAEEYQIKLLDGEKFTFKVKEQYDKGLAGKIEQIKALGLRGSEDEDSDDEQLIIGVWQSLVGETPTGKKEDIDEGEE